MKVFRKPIHTGKVGRRRLILTEGVMIGGVVKRCQRRRVV